MVLPLNNYDWDEIMDDYDTSIDFKLDDKKTRNKEMRT